MTETGSHEVIGINQKFTHRVTHPEAGVEGPHGPGEEETEGHAGREAGGDHGEGERGEHGQRERGEHSQRERGEHSHSEAGEHSHGEGDTESGNRPGAASLRPVYNQLQLLRGEMRAFSADVKAKKKD